MNAKRFSRLMFLAALGVILQSTISAATGDLDPSFGQNGIVTTVIGNYSDFAYDAAVQSDGKIVAVGVMQVYNSVPTPRAAIARYNPDGTLDASFGNGGTIAHLNFGLNSGYTSVVIQSDGKILAAGGVLSATGGATSNFLVVRYNTNGTLDNSFGNAGIVSTDFRPGSVDGTGQILLQSDGKILIVGEEGSYPGKNFAVLRYNADGSLDATFDGDGKSSTAFSEPVSYSPKGVLQPDGKIIVAGLIENANVKRFALARHNSNGTLDTSFGDGGKLVVAAVGGTSFSPTVVVQSNGKIIIVGTNGSSETSDAVLIRYSSNGSLDQSFGSNGVVRTDINNLSNGASDAVVQSDDKITVLGGVFDSGSRRATLMRYNSDGTLDAGFGQSGIVQYPNISHNAIALQSDGKIITAGDTASFPLKFSVARFLNDAPSNRRFDFDGDGKADVSVFRPSNGVWYLLNSQNGFAAAQFGAATDRLVPADYDGDGRTDLAVYRSGTWFLSRSSHGFLGASFDAFGLSFADPADIPQPADLDGDGKAELVIFRPSNGIWYSYNLATGQRGAAQFGQNGDRPVIADYDGDGKADLAVFRPGNGVWYLNRSQLGFTGVQFGAAEDKPVAADYDGDGKIDLAVFRPSNGVWYLNRSQLGFTGIAFGAGSDLPTPADYDGDGKTDVAVFRPSNGTWYLQRSLSGLTGVAFGDSADRPIPNAFVP